MTPYSFIVTFYLLSGMGITPSEELAYNRDTHKQVESYIECLEQADKYRRAMLKSFNGALFCDVTVECKHN